MRLGEGYLSASNARGCISLTRPSLPRPPACPLPQGERADSLARLIFRSSSAAMMNPMVATAATPGFVRFTSQTARAQHSDLAAHNARALQSVRPFARVQRGQGMPGEGLTHGPPARKMQAAGTTGATDQPAFPARWSSRLYAVSLVHRACWPPCATTRFHALPRGHQHRGVRTLRLHVRALPFVGASEDTLRQNAAIASHLACRDDRAQRLRGEAG